MSQPRFTWRDPKFTYADALSGSRLVMLPYLIYSLVARLPGLAVTTIAAMIVTDLIDGRVARLLGKARPSGAAFDSTIDFIVIYGLFTTFFAIGVLPWWKWIVIFLPGVLMAVTQLRHLRAAPGVEFAPAAVGKLVGQIQYVYLPFLVLRTFWWSDPWTQTMDDVVFVVLIPPIILNARYHLRMMLRPGL